MKSRVKWLNGTPVDYDNSLFDPTAGSLIVSKTGQHKRIVVFVTNDLDVLEKKDEIIKEAQAQNTEIYVITLGMDCPDDLKELAEQTGGLYFLEIYHQKKKPRKHSCI